MESLAAEAHRHVDDGFRRVKMRLGRTWNYDRLAFQTVKSAVGPNVDVMVDGSMRYSFDDAVQLGRLLGEDGTFWFEEPFAPEDLESFRRLRRTISVPLAAGENECSAAGFEDLARGPAVDIMQPDASRAGGISAVWNVCELGARRGLRVATHTWSDAVAVMANAHAIAAADAGLTVEVDRTGTPVCGRAVDDTSRDPRRAPDAFTRAWPRYHPRRGDRRKVSRHQGCTHPSRYLLRHGVRAIRGDRVDRWDGK